MNVFYENFGLRPFQVEKNKIIYGEKIEGGKHIIMTVFQEHRRGMESRVQAR